MSVKFLDFIKPQQGYIHIQGLGGNANPPMPHKRKNFSTAQEAWEYADALSVEGYDVYFSTASLKNATDKRELKAYCASRVVQFDIDVNENGEKGLYTSITEARVSLFEFLRDVKLPKPTIVISGYGLHCYFVFDRDLSFNEKINLSNGFVKLSKEKGLRIDYGCTTDAVRLLRLPNTYNYKFGLKVPVQLATFGSIVAVEEMLEKLSSHNKPASFLDTPPPDGVGDLQGIRKILKNAMVRDWRHILNRSLLTNTIKIPYKDPQTSKKEVIDYTQSKGCEQIRRAYLDQNSVKEPIWKGILGLINACDGTADEKIQWGREISEKYEAYKEEEMIKKLFDRDGYPTTCKFFRGENEDPCTHCEFANRQMPLTSPLQLSQIYAEASPEDNIVETHASDVGGKITITIPDDFPFPYFRSKAGGVIYRGTPPDKKPNKTEEESEVEDTIIYQRDFWLHRRVMDQFADGVRHSGGGAVGHWMHLTPHEGLKEIIVPASMLAKQDTLIGYLQSHGIHVAGVKAKLLALYMNAFMAYDQSNKSQYMARDKFGWHDNDTKFLIGKREINQQGDIEFSPVCANLSTLFSFYNKVGTLEEWKSVINTYNNPGCEVRAAALFMGFGSPLYKFLNIGSAILHLSNPESGVGKSTIQMCISSIYGHPSKGLLNLNDTVLSIQSRMASLSNLPVLIDEVTNIEAERLSNFVFNFSQNRERNRMYSGVNAERRNETAWETIGVTSGNNSLLDLLRSFKKRAEGETYRVMELYVPRDKILSKKEADKLFHEVLHENYGLAGELYMQYVVQNVDLVKHRLKIKQRYLDNAIKLQPRDRFHSAMLAAAFTGAEIAAELGLHDIDVKRIEEYIIRTHRDSKSNTDSQFDASGDVSVIMGTLLSKISGNLIVVDGEEENLNKGILNKGCYRMPHGEIRARYEKATGVAAVSETDWHEFCSSNRIGARETLRELKDKGLLIGVKPYDLSTGTDLPRMNVNCIVFKHKKDFNIEGV